MTNIVFKRPDGDVAIVVLSPEAIANGVSLEDHAKELKERGDIPADYEMVAQAIELPATREWREAWSWTTDAPVIDIDHDKATAITKDRLRKEREPLLQAQDIAFMQAMEQGIDTKPIVAEKQRLRDITKLADKAETLEELKAISV